MRVIMILYAKNQRFEGNSQNMAAQGIYILHKMKKRAHQIYRNLICPLL